MVSSKQTEMADKKGRVDTMSLLKRELASVLNLKKIKSDGDSTIIQNETVCFRTHKTVISKKVISDLFTKMI